MTYSCRLLAASAFVFLAGCSILGDSDEIAPLHGIVVAEEPQAAEIGAAVLNHGGNAADAAAATYFALATTYPVAAGLGGGGLCIVHAGERNSTFDFLPREPEKGGAYAVPGNVSGFASLQAAFGRLPWQRVISPAESLSAAGFILSDALATRLAGSIDTIRLDASLSAEFLDESGKLKKVGTQITDAALSQTLSRLRTDGPEVFYRGGIARQIITYSGDQGGALTAADLGDYKTGRSEPAIARTGDETIYLPPASTAAGRLVKAIFARVLHGQGPVPGAGGLSRDTVSAVDAAAAITGIASPIRDLGATGFAAVDPQGMAVACAVTMNGPFGSGHSVSAAGITLADAPQSGPSGIPAAFLTPLIGIADGGAILIAGAGTGGGAASAGIVTAALAAARGENITQPGLLLPTGHEPSQTVSAIGCRNAECAITPHPRGFGFGAAG